MLELTCAWTRRILEESGGIIPSSSSSWISLPKERILLQTVPESCGKPLEMQLLVAFCKMSL